ncbi:MAG: TonB system transport protein ExbD [Rhizobiales bacterium]|nr:TonB system transport protein ExbD [Hyphomicrobiales bacterium]
MAARLQDSDDELSENSEINVTPFIDVMLVLLIVFMIAAPLATVDVPVELPRSNAKAAPREGKPLFLSIGRDLGLKLGNDPVDPAALGVALDQASGGNREERIYLRADRRIDYGEVVEVMNRLRDAGYAKVALVGLDAGR